MSKQKRIPSIESLTEQFILIGCNQADASTVIVNEGLSVSMDSFKIEVGFDQWSSILSHVNMVVNKLGSSCRISVLFVALNSSAKLLTRLRTSYGLKLNLMDILSLISGDIGNEETIYGGCSTRIRICALLVHKWYRFQCVKRMLTMIFTEGSSYDNHLLRQSELQLNIHTGILVSTAEFVSTHNDLSNFVIYNLIYVSEEFRGSEKLLTPGPLDEFLIFFLTHARSIRASMGEYSISRRDSQSSESSFKSAFSSASGIDTAYNWILESLCRVLRSIHFGVVEKLIKSLYHLSVTDANICFSA